MIEGGPAFEMMQHPDLQSDLKDPRTPTHTELQLREPNVNEDTPSRNQDPYIHHHSRRTRSKSAESHLSGFSVIIEEDVGVSQPGSPDRSGGISPRIWHDRLYESSSSGHTSIRERPRKHSSASSVETYETNATSTLPAQHGKNFDEAHTFDSLLEDEFRSYDLAPPDEDMQKLHSMETLADILFSQDHLKTIFADPSLLLKFTAYLSTYRPRSVPILIYYLDATKALKAINYANALAEALEPISGYDFTSFPAKTTLNSILEDKADQAFNVLVQEDLPAYITHVYVQVVHLSIERRITGVTLPRSHEASDGLAEVFCLSDPSRPDNPIVFASEGFTQTTQYGMNYILGRNCRFLQGPKTSPFSVRRIRKSIEAGREHCEVFLNYRRDGSPFLNLLLCAPLYDSFGKIRYFLGAQVDISSIVNEGTDLESLQRLVAQKASNRNDPHGALPSEDEEKKNEFQQLSEMLDIQELNAVRKWGGRMLTEHQEADKGSHKLDWRRPGLVLRDPSRDHVKGNQLTGLSGGRLTGFYENYLLVRPYPSLRILFASPSQRVPGILQSPIMNRIGGSARVRDELTQALAEGRGVTAKVRWISRPDDEGRNRWIHCTPLIGSNGQIGVWMLVIVDDEQEDLRRSKQAPPVMPNTGSAPPIPARKDPAANIQGAWSSRLDPELGPRRDWNGPNGTPERQTQPSDWTLDTPRRDRAIDNPDADGDQEYETLEERLQNKRRLEASRLYEQPGSVIPVRRTYKSLSPYPFSLDD